MFVQQFVNEKQMKVFIQLLLISFFIWSCESIDSNNSSDSSTEVINSEVDSLFTVETGSYNLSLVLPKSMVTEKTRFIYRPNFGDVELFVNQKFHLFLSNEKISLPQVKKELNDDALFQFKFYDEAQDELLYQAVLPDGTEMGFNWVKIVEAENAVYNLKTNPQSNFSRQNIRIIQEYLKTLKTA